jgi:hypothetical protein
MSSGTITDHDIRVTSVLVRATALSDELRSTIKELETILRRPEEELIPLDESTSPEQHRKGS